MTTPDYRKTWMETQSELRPLLEKGPDYQRGLQLCLRQHAWLHSNRLATDEPWSYEDELLDDLDEATFRHIAAGQEHSIAWAVWHLARIEDTAMNLLVAGSPQVFDQDWRSRLGVEIHNTGNEMSPAAVADLSAQVNLPALRAYRLAVGQRTRQIIQGLSAEQLGQKVEPERIERVHAEGAVLRAASYISDYWSKRTIAGLLLMPATRHNFVHLNEIAALKKRRQ